MKKKTRKLSALQKGMRAIAKPVQERQRELLPFLDSMLLIDDSGGECITSFDDATACHYFLFWLRKQRAIKLAKHKAMKAAINRRKHLKLVGGN